MTQPSNFISQQACSGAQLNKTTMLFFFSSGVTFTPAARRELVAAGPQARLRWPDVGVGTAAGLDA